MFFPRTAQGVGDAGRGAQDGRDRAVLARREVDGAKNLGRIRGIGLDVVENVNRLEDSRMRRDPLALHIDAERFDLHAHPGEDVHDIEAGASSERSKHDLHRAGAVQGFLGESMQLRVGDVSLAAWGDVLEKRSTLPCRRGRHGVRCHGDPSRWFGADPCHVREYHRETACSKSLRRVESPIPKERLCG